MLRDLWVVVAYMYIGIILIYKLINYVWSHKLYLYMPYTGFAYVADRGVELDDRSVPDHMQSVRVMKNA